MRKIYLSAVVDPDLCRGDKICENICVAKAIEVNNKKATVDENRCVSCEKCMDACPEGAITMVPKKEPILLTTNPDEVDRHELEQLCKRARLDPAKIICGCTLTTAKEMGVKSRLDPAQSIEGGAKYLSKLEKRIPDSVEGDDRWWFALAAYNVGMGHLRDARKLAEELGLDADSWLDLKGVLPLLAQKKYYKKLKYGYARGAEPVVYVRQIRNYQNILRAQLARKRGIHG